MPEIGLVSVSFRALHPAEIVRRCVGAGLPYIEWGSDVHAKPEDTARLREIAAMQDATGIRCSSYGTYFRVGQSDPRDFTKYLDASDILGTDTLRLWCGVKASVDYSAAEREKVIEDGKDLAAQAEARGKRLLMECHPGTLTDDTDSALSVIGGVGSPAFGMMWQPNQFRTPEYNLDSARRLSPYVGNVHVFEWDTSRRYPLADGTERWRSFLRLLPSASFCLLEFVPGDDPDVLPREAESLRYLLKGV